MALTDAEKTELKNDILNAIKAESQGVNELTEVTSLDNIKSLPALRGSELVSAPVSLLGKPATDAAATANAAATKANNAATTATNAASSANSAATTASEKAGVAVAAAETANEAAEAAQAVVSEYESTALSALHGATARFEAIVENGTVLPASTTLAGGRVVWLRSAKNFVYEAGGSYYNNWSVDGVPSASLYHDGLSLLNDKSYIMGDTLYAWSDEENDLVEISGSGGGNTYNVTEEVPPESGYYTLTTAIAAVDGKYRCKGRCITYEVSQGKWETKQFCGTSLAAWESAGAWEDFGGAGTMKSLTVNGEKQVPDSEGA